MRLASTRQIAMPLGAGIYKMSGSRLVFARNRQVPSRSAFRSYTPLRVNAVLEETVKIPDERLRMGQTQATEAVGAQQGEAPGDADRRRFRLHWSVEMWRNFNPRSWADALDDETAPLTVRFRSLIDTLTSAASSSGVLSSSQASRYWAYHLARTGFFAAQAIVGLAAARASSGTPQEGGALTRLEQIARNGYRGPIGEAMFTFYQDYENIKEGRYAMPWDATTLTHRQLNPLFVLSKGARFVSEAAETLLRRERGSPDAVWMKSPFLPDYYQNTFHYQTDGWMSGQSAGVYETSTETLFIGRQDAMQRCTLVPMSEFMAGRDSSQTRALEIACGTGRFATFVKDNFPRLDLTVTDLSPFYLQEARSNLRYWTRQRASDAMLPGVDGNGVSFVQAAAEKLPFENESFDVVYSLYLFHELPEDVRHAAIKEMARVLKPGGMIILTDSVQTGDRPALDGGLGAFGDFNEPYYRNYLADDLGKAFEAVGMNCDLKVVCSSTKTLSFRKEAEQPKSTIVDVNAVEEKPAAGFVGDPRLN